MRVLMLNWRDPENPKAGGAEHVTLEHLKAMVERGHDVWWFTHRFELKPEGQGPPVWCKPEVEIDGIHVVRRYSGLAALRAARQWYRAQPRFDLVVDQHHGIPWYAPLWCGTRRVSYIHEVLGPVWGVFFKWPLRTIGRWQEHLTLRAYANVPFWVPSKATEGALRNIGVKRVTFIPNGIGLDPLPELEPKPITAGQRKVRLIVVSRLVRYKQVDHVLEAVKLMRSMQWQPELTIVGCGEDEDRLKRLSEHLRVSFTGRVEEATKANLLREAHVLVNASLMEGWGLNVIEANAMGTPAVVYPSPGLTESTLDGVTGIVARTSSPLDLAEAIMRLCDSEAYGGFRRRAWMRSKELTWKALLPQVVEWLESGGDKVTSAAK